MRAIDLPPLTDAKEISSAVQFQAQDHIPMPLEQAILEHQVLGQVETPEGPRTRVMVVAARRDMIDRLLEAANRAGLSPQGIDQPDETVLMLDGAESTLSDEALPVLAMA